MKENVEKRAGLLWNGVTPEFRALVGEIGSSGGHFLTSRRPIFGPHGGQFLIARGTKNWPPEASKMASRRAKMDRHGD